MKIKKLLLLSLLVATGIFLRSGSAFAATKTWDGGGSDNKFSTAANWDSDTIPADGDSLVFPASVAPTDYNDSLDADIADLSVIGITFSGDSGSTCNSNYLYYNINSGSIDLNGSISLSDATGICWSEVTLPNINLTGNSTVAGGSSNVFLGIGQTGQTFAMGSHSLTMSGSYLAYYLASNITGSGALNTSGWGYLDGNNSTYSGVITVQAGRLTVSHANALGTSAITIPDGSSLYFLDDPDYTVANNITLTGGPQPESGKIGFGVSGGGPCSESHHTITLSGVLSLSNNADAFGGCYAKLDIQNPQLNGHTLSLMSGSTGTLKVGNDTQSPQYVDETISDSSSSTSLSIGAFERKFLNGSRGAISVFASGILGGTGTASTISVYKNGILAPGMSPGCLSSGNLLIDEGVYRTELGGLTACTEFDQMKITGTVTLSNNPSLEVSHYNNYKPKAGNSFKIIDNDGSEAITGTFKNLSEGATFKLSGYVYKISYKGGDGNDAVITVVTVGTPDTGFSLMLNSPIAILAGATFAAAGMIVLSKRMKFAHKPAKRSRR